MKTLLSQINESMMLSSKEEYALILLACYADQHPDILKECVKNQDELYKA